MRALPRSTVFSLVFFAMINLRQFLRGNRRLHSPRIERKIKLPDTPPFLEFIIVDIGSIVLRKPEQQHGAFAPAVGDQRPKPTTLSLSRACDTLFDESAAQIGINQTAFGGQDGFNQCCIRNTLTTLKPHEALDLVNLHVPPTHATITQ